MSQSSSPRGISGMGMLPRKLFDLGAHTATEHEGDHFVVAHERPKRIFKGGGLVLLDQKMREPCAAVTGYEPEKEEPPFADRDEIDQQRNTGRRPDQMKHARRRTAVFRNIKRPELTE